MSHLYELSENITLTTLVAVFTLVAGSGTQAEIREITVTQTAATARSELGLGRPAANGTGTVTGTLVQPADGSDAAGQTTMVPAGGFGTAQPTIPANFMRRGQMATVAASGWCWTWEPGELIIAPSGQLVIWQIAGNSVFDCYVKLAE